MNMIPAGQYNRRSYSSAKMDIKAEDTTKSINIK